MGVGTLFYTYEVFYNGYVGGTQYDVWAVANPPVTETVTDELTWRKRGLYFLLRRSKENNKLNGRCQSNDSINWCVRLIMHAEEEFRLLKGKLVMIRAP